MQRFSTRQLLVDRVRKERWSVAEAARAAGVTRRTAYKWLKRFEEGGEAALQDRSSRPHRIHADRSRKKRGVGWEVVFVCVDDHTRLAYAEVLPAESGKHATAFFRRALRWFDGLGIRCRRVLTDNAKCYAEAKAFLALCAEHGIRQSFTRPYTPRTNGKAERFIQTLKRRWAYRHPYRTSAIRAASLRPWVNHYNHVRPHRELGKRPPRARLREAREQRT